MQDGERRQRLAKLRGLRAGRSYAKQSVDADLLVELLEVARWSGSARNRQPWHWTVCRQSDDRDLLARSGYFAAFLSDAPVVLVLSLDSNVGGMDAEFDAGRATQLLLTAADAVGLATCPATLDPQRMTELQEHLGLDPSWQPRWAVGVGYPAPTAPLGTSAIPTGRRALDDVVTWR